MFRTWTILSRSQRKNHLGCSADFQVRFTREYPVNWGIKEFLRERDEPGQVKEACGREKRQRAVYYLTVLASTSSHLHSSLCLWLTWLHFSISSHNSWSDYKIMHLKLSLFQRNMSLSPKRIHSPFPLTPKDFILIFKYIFFRRKYGKGVARESQQPLEI